MTLVKKILGATAGILFSVSVFAESIAVIDVQKIVAQLPQTQAMMQTLNEEFAGPREELTKLQSDIKFSIEKFQRESMTMSQEEQEALKVKIEGMQKEFQSRAQPLDQQLKQRQTEERNKILALVKEAVDAVAAEEKIDIVLQAQSIVFVTPEKDISDKVTARISKLN
ncbi:OmpH family outer membrane protein [Psychrosphaera sp. B3R10]|uniref:OmpH family outer membrane protein n=1 Tax=Psychrosphaera algicola TaxID=3023714 RepID=A0ABT5FA60_9GAMM|nr:MULTISPECIES: OmpH family outer membrane protein [unclassified Psychrosphaera]MBU2883896.1 OmpH family outer membrane protein [Psychrosphaera sp. I2R16]MBU2988759.1 OmpH family outer membrane protein [Psychrosphaera sp. B3R10]MDC2888421.1 OmpH family outer membrane protein [Psychrosphaera sp. G1-22]MDO6718553.1 OmpH family outer membrane protein [Psychrosphaera sp. 1_MG-2023]